VEDTISTVLRLPPWLG